MQILSQNLKLSKKHKIFFKVPQLLATVCCVISDLIDILTQFLSWCFLVVRSHATYHATDAWVLTQWNQYGQMWSVFSLTFTLCMVLDHLLSSWSPTFLKSLRNVWPVNDNSHPPFPL